MGRKQKSVVLKQGGDMVKALASGGAKLSDSMRVSILARGDEIVPELIAVLQDRKLGLERAPGRGFVPIHAAKLLSELKAVEAIEPMLVELLNCDAYDYLYDALLHALNSFGSLALEPTLRAFAAAKNDGDRMTIVGILAGLGVRDSRIFAILLQWLEANTEHGAGCLAEYGDPMAIPYLSSALEKCEFDFSAGFFGNQEIIDLASAIEELGGKLTERQKQLRSQVVPSRRVALGMPAKGTSAGAASRAVADLLSGL